MAIQRFLLGILAMFTVGTLSAQVAGITTPGSPEPPSHHQHVLAAAVDPTLVEPAAGVFSQNNELAFFATRNEPFRILKLRLQTTGVTLESSLLLEEEIGGPVHAAADTSNGHAYFVTDSDPPHVVKVEMTTASGAPPALVDILRLPEDIGPAQKILLFPREGQGLVITKSEPANLAKFLMDDRAGGGAMRALGVARMRKQAEIAFAMPITSTRAVIGSAATPHLLTVIDLQPGQDEPGEVTNEEFNLPHQKFAAAYYFGAEDRLLAFTSEPSPHLLQFLFDGTDDFAVEHEVPLPSFVSETYISADAEGDMLIAASDADRPFLLKATVGDDIVPPQIDNDGDPLAQDGGFFAGQVLTTTLGGDTYALTSTTGGFNGFFLTETGPFEQPWGAVSSLEPVPNAITSSFVELGVTTALLVADDDHVYGLSRTDGTLTKFRLPPLPEPPVALEPLPMSVRSDPPGAMAVFDEDFIMISSARTEDNGTSKIIQQGNDQPPTFQIVLLQSPGYGNSQTGYFDPNSNTAIFGAFGTAGGAYRISPGTTPQDIPSFGGFVGFGAGSGVPVLSIHRPFFLEGLFVTDSDPAHIFKIDTPPLGGSPMAVTAEDTIDAGGMTPVGIAIDPDRNHAYVSFTGANSAKLAKLNIEAQFDEIAIIDLPDNIGNGMVFSPDRGLLIPTPRGFFRVNPGEGAAPPVLLGDGFATRPPQIPLNGFSDPHFGPDGDTLVAQSGPAAPNLLHMTYSPVGLEKATLVDTNLLRSAEFVGIYTHQPGGNLRIMLYREENEEFVPVWRSGSVPNTGGFVTVGIADGAPAASPLDLPTGRYWIAWTTDSPTASPSYSSGSQGSGWLRAARIEDKVDPIPFSDVQFTTENYTAYIGNDSPPELIPNTIWLVE